MLSWPHFSWATGVKLGGERILRDLRSPTSYLRSPRLTSDPLHLILYPNHHHNETVCGYLSNSSQVVVMTAFLQCAWIDFDVFGTFFILVLHKTFQESDNDKHITWFQI